MQRMIRTVAECSSSSGSIMLVIDDSEREPFDIAMCVHPTVFVSLHVASATHVVWSVFGLNVVDQCGVWPSRGSAAAACAAAVCAAMTAAFAALVASFPTACGMIDSGSAPVPAYREPL